ncbi:hypothetical protein VV01_01955 [Luteipulveratus halotolerans]|uniref:HTH luxR-type domain-containing protein n=1 Tax=Luteipulveratus halotolerans TaxID=1631356 RepID=A0A0L6CF36_9MICO|nr:hypothetical protein VV01_01955 [Luteipulveratus halotolerans]
MVDHELDDHVDVLLVDQRCEGLDELVEQSRVPVVVWGGYRHESWAAGLRERGAAAYVTLLAHPADVAIALRRAFHGLTTYPSLAGAPQEQLTQRELEVVHAYACAFPHLSREQVAGRLQISENTLRVHLGRARRKLGLGSRSSRVQLRRAVTARDLSSSKGLA